MIQENESESRLTSLKIAQDKLRGEGFETVMEEECPLKDDSESKACIRFVGGQEKAVNRVRDAIECVQGGDSTELTESLEDMGLAPGLRSGYLIAKPA